MQEKFNFYKYYWEIIRYYYEYDRYKSQFWKIVNHNKYLSEWEMKQVN